jgi:hypothetical protein
VLEVRLLCCHANITSTSVQATQGGMGRVGQTYWRLWVD